MRPLAPELAEALAALSDAMSEAAHPWWLIGSVAVALHGGDPGGIADIDVVIDPRDLSGVLQRTGATVQPKDDSTLFRSERFATWHAFGIPVEFMAGFHLHAEGAWQPVRPASRLSRNFGENPVFFPDRADLISMLHAFGRPKDLRRAEALERLAT